MEKYVPDWGRTKIAPTNSHRLVTTVSVFNLRECVSPLRENRFKLGVKSEVPAIKDLSARNMQTVYVVTCIPLTK